MFLRDWVVIHIFWCLRGLVNSAISLRFAFFLRVNSRIASMLPGILGCQLKLIHVRYKAWALMRGWRSLNRIKCMITDFLSSIWSKCQLLQLIKDHVREGIILIHLITWVLYVFQSVFGLVIDNRDVGIEELIVKLLFIWWWLLLWLTLWLALRASKCLDMQMWVIRFLYLEAIINWLYWSAFIRWIWNYFCFISLSRGQADVVLAFCS